MEELLVVKEEVKEIEGMFASVLNVLKKTNKERGAKYDCHIDTSTPFMHNLINDINDRVGVNHSDKVSIYCDTQPNIVEGVNGEIEHKGQHVEHMVK